MGRNTEQYVDDVVVKSREGDNLLRDLEETFASLHKVNIKLNPAKCVFGVPLFKIMKKTGTFKWTPEADKAFEELKTYLASAPVMVALGWTSN